jgi:hypothetical protein
VIAVPKLLALAYACTLDISELSAGSAFGRFIRSFSLDVELLIEPFKPMCTISTDRLFKLDFIAFMIQRTTIQWTTEGTLMVFVYAGVRHISCRWHSVVRLLIANVRCAVMSDFLCVGLRLPSWYDRFAIKVDIKN